MLRSSGHRWGFRGRDCIHLKPLHAATGLLHHCWPCVVGLSFWNHAGLSTCQHLSGCSASMDMLLLLGSPLGQSAVLQISCRLRSLSMPELAVAWVGRKR